MRFNGIFLTIVKTVALLLKESERCEFGPCPDVDRENGREHLTQCLGSEEFYAIELADSGKKVGSIFCASLDFEAGEHEQRKND